MDNDFNTEKTDPNFGTQLAITYAQSAALSAVTVVVMLGVMGAVSKVHDLKEKKAQAKFDAAFNKTVINFTHRPQS